MKNAPILAIALIILGVAALAYQGISYTTREKAVDIGPIEINTEERHTIPLPPILGVIAIAGGIWLLVKSKK
jgi:hypothetical protein